MLASFQDSLHTPVARRVGLAIWAGAVGLYIGLTGVVFNRQLALSAGMGLVIVMTVTGGNRLVRVLADWLPFLSFIYLYDATRGWAGKDRFVHVTEPITIDKALGFGNVPTVWLQQRLYIASQVQWWEAMVGLVYMSHFLVPYVFAVVLWLRNREAWKRWAIAFFTTSSLGILGYVLYPMAPPWLAAGTSRYPYRDAAMEGVARISRRGLSVLNMDFAQKAFISGSRFANDVAAMPSLHEAFAVLFALHIIRSWTSPWRWLISLYPLAMGFALVYGGEHYVVDLLAGALVAAIGSFIAFRLVPLRKKSSEPYSSNRVSAPFEISNA